MSGAVPVTLVTSGGLGDTARYRAMLTMRGEGPGCLARVARAHGTTIGRVRHWITRKLYKQQRVLMVDDDLWFYVNGARAGPMDMRRLVSAAGQALARAPIVLMQGNAGFVALDLAALHGRVRYGRVPILEHVDFILRAAKRDVPIVYMPAEWRCAQVGGGRNGGCADYRTQKLELAVARQIARRYPQYKEQLRCNENSTPYRNNDGVSAQKRKSVASRC